MRRPGHRWPRASRCRREHRHGGARLRPCRGRPGQSPQPLPEDRPQAHAAHRPPRVHVRRARLSTAGHAGSLTPMLCSLSLSLALALAGAPAPGDLSPEAAEHNAKAMRFYDAGQLAPAVDEFYAAYQSMPDARGSLAGREQLLGSMRATLLALLAENGDVAPLCRLQSLLQGHADALTAAYPDDPNKLETRSARATGRSITARVGPARTRRTMLAPASTRCRSGHPMPRLGRTSSGGPALRSAHATRFSSISTASRSDQERGPGTTAARDSPRPVPGCDDMSTGPIFRVASSPWVGRGQ